MIIAAALIWTLTMQSSHGMVTFGPYDDLKTCRVAALKYLATHDQFNWHKAACYNSSGKTVVIEKDR